MFIRIAITWQLLKTYQVVLIHGLSIPSIVWKDVVSELTAKGCRVLVYGAYPNPK